jgi:hypothetical protein
MHGRTIIRLFPLTRICLGERLVSAEIPMGSSKRVFFFEQLVRPRDRLRGTALWCFPPRWIITDRLVGGEEGER